LKIKVSVWVASLQREPFWFRKKIYKEIEIASFTHKSGKVKLSERCSPYTSDVHFQLLIATWVLITMSWQDFLVQLSFSHSF